MAAARERRSDKGFTLIEVLAAFVILALFLAALLPALSGSLAATRAGTHLFIATGYAQSLIDGVGANGAVSVGEFRNTFEKGRYRYVLRVKPMANNINSSNAPRLFEVTAHIEWGQSARGSSVTLTTTRYARALNQ